MEDRDKMGLSGRAALWLCEVVGGSLANTRIQSKKRKAVVSLAKQWARELTDESIA